MMARSLKAPSIGRIQKRKTNLLQIIIFGLQRAAGPYRWAKSRQGKTSILSLEDSVREFYKRMRFWRAQGWKDSLAN